MGSGDAALTTRIALYSPSLSGTNEAELASTIAASLRPDFHVDMYSTKLAYLSGLFHAKGLIVHSPLAFSIVPVTLAKLLRKPVVGFVWDNYPVTINGRRYDNRLRRKIGDLIERLTLTMADHLVVQTRDFLLSPNLARAEVIPFWHPPRGFSQRNVKPKEANAPFQFAFAGQINETRGLQDSLVKLDRLLERKAVVSIYSGDPFIPPIGMRKIDVQHCGHLPKEKLTEALINKDFGLVSLHTGFEGPAFPSKSLDYIGAGLPIIYFGPPLFEFTTLLETTGCGVHANSMEKFDFEKFLNSYQRDPVNRSLFANAISADGRRLKFFFDQVVRG